MKKSMFYIFFIVLSAGLLSGCNQVDELLEKANQLLDQQLADDQDSDGNEDLEDELPTETEPIDDTNELDEDEDEIEEVNNEDTNESTLETQLPFDERLAEQGYEQLVLPNGFPFEVPYHWIVVEDQAQNSETTFCFDLPLEIEEIASHFEHFDEVNQEQHEEGNKFIHTTTFSMDFGVNEVSGTSEYFLDEYDNTCALVTISFGEGEQEEEFYGEDPSTMVSEEELAAMEGTQDNEDVSTDRTRSLPDGYEDNLNEYRENHNLEDMDFDADDVMSIKDKISNGDIEMIHLANGYPTIFPYEWYLLNKEEDHGSGAWTGTFCTDTPMAQAITKHHDMLADLDADIINYDINGSPQMNEKASVEFAFNDIYGTGSWHGNTLFYIDRNDAYQVHKCAQVSMEFSPELLQ